MPHVHVASVFLVPHVYVCACMRVCVRAPSVRLPLSANSNAKGETPLILAAKARSAPCVELLLRAKADLSATDADGSSALHHAASLEDEASLLLLVDAGADPTVANEDGKDVLALLERHDMATLAPVFEHYRLAYLRRQAIATRLRAYLAGVVPPYHAEEAVAVFAEERLSGDEQRLRQPHLQGSDSVVASAAATGAAWEDTHALELYRSRPWAETSHRYCPPCMREAICTLLLASQRREEGDACCLPSELWLQVFHKMHRDWFDDDCERRRRAAVRERKQRAEEARAARAAADAEDGARRASRLHEGSAQNAGTPVLVQELLHAEDALRMLQNAVQGDEIARMAVLGPLNLLTQKRDELRRQLASAATQESAAPDPQDASLPRPTLP